MILLKEDYYLQLFETQVHWVTSKYSDLISNDCKNFIDQFASFSKDAKRLYLRLYLRTSDFFLVEKLNYDEIAEIHKAIEELAQHSWVNNNPMLSNEQIGKLLTIKDLTSYLLPNQKGSKKQLIEKLPKTIQAAHAWHQTLNIISIKRLPAIDFIQLIFFGNRHQHITDLILQANQANQFENYQILGKSFENKAHLDEFFIRNQWLKEFESQKKWPVKELNEFFHQLKKHRKVTTLWDKPAMLLAKQFEQQKQLSLALEIYKLTNIPPSRERQARLLVKLNQTSEAKSLCIQIKNNPIDISEMDFSQFFIAKLNGEKANRYNKKYDENIITIDRDKEFYIEDDVIKQWPFSGEVYNVENGLINSIFGLFFWQEIYDLCPEQFIHPLQSGPNDTFSHQFYLNRQQYIDKKLNQISNDHFFNKTILENFNKKQGISSYYVHWQLLDESLLRRTLKNIPANHWLVYFKQLLADPKSYRSGFPDLISFSADSYQWHEVKGPGDQLQNSQRRWLEVFENNDINFEVLRIEYND